MKTPTVSRPNFPKGYVDNPTSYLDWSWVVAQLTDAQNYWLCSVRPDGRPHVIPCWGVYVDGRIYYDGSPETRHNRNIEVNPHMTIHLENGTEAVILEGRCELARKPDSELGKMLSKAYKKKYKDFGYAPGPNSWDEGGLYVFTPRQCIAWTSFTENPTKYIFDIGEES